MNILSAAYHLFLKNPRLFFVRVFLEIKMRACSPFLLEKGAFKSMRGVKFYIPFQEARNRKRMYFGLCEMGVVNTMEIFLKKGDIFIDVGANVGHLSAVGAGLVGKEGQVHCFEPVPRCAERLRELAAANPEYPFFINAVALGDTEGTIPLFVSSVSMGQSSVVPGKLTGSEIEKTILVPVKRLDAYLRDKGIMRVKMIKIDVEGFELAVLRGLREFFQETRELPLLICEIAPFAHKDLDELFSYLEGFSYAPFDIVNSKKPLSKKIIAQSHTINVLFKPSASRQ